MYRHLTVVANNTEKELEDWAKEAEERKKKQEEQRKKDNEKVKRSYRLKAKK